jgi:hypothetical protein
MQSPAGIKQHSGALKRLEQAQHLCVSHAESIKYHTRRPPFLFPACYLHLHFFGCCICPVCQLCCWLPNCGRCHCHYIRGRLQLRKQCPIGPNRVDHLFSASGHSDQDIMQTRRVRIWCSYRTCSRGRCRHSLWHYRFFQI